MSQPALRLVEGSSMDKSKALSAALSQIERQFGKGSVMKLGKNDKSMDIETVSTGSLGHGLPVGLGMALAGRILGLDYRVCVVMSDGECNEGSVWEAAMLAPSLKLDRLIAVVDFNKWQATDRSEDVMALSPLADKWRAFGWETREVDGHDVEALASAMRGVPDGSGRPLALIAHTVKGKGVSFMEDDNNWHYAILKEAQLLAAKKELGL